MCFRNAIGFSIILLSDAQPTLNLSSTSGNKKMKIRLGGLLLVVACECQSSGMTGGGGTVLETGTEAAIANATVELECRRLRFPEGSEKIKELRTRTDQNGRYSFTTRDVSDCDMAYVHAVKPGYVSTSGIDLRYSHSKFSRIPTTLVLTPEESASMQRLQFLASMARASSSPTKWYLYMVIYGHFSEAKSIATQVKEKEYVVQEFCGRLNDLYAGLSQEEKKNLDGQHIAGFRGGYRIDHDAEVVPYCKSAQR